MWLCKKYQAFWQTRKLLSRFYFVYWHYCIEPLWIRGKTVCNYMTASVVQKGKRQMHSVENYNKRAKVFWWADCFKSVRTIESAEYLGGRPIEVSGYYLKFNQCSGADIADSCHKVSVYIITTITLIRSSWSVISLSNWVGRSGFIPLTLHTLSRLMFTNLGHSKARESRRG